MVRLLKSGDTATVTLRAAADRPVAAWTISAVDRSGAPADAPYFELVLDRRTVSAGDEGTLRITMRRVPPTRLAVIGLQSTLDGISDTWPLAVVME